MSQQETLEILLDIGEDFACQIFWTDEDGQPVPVVAPAKMQVRDARGQLVLDFHSDNDPEDEASISVTGASGLLQISVPRTLTRPMVPGRYLCDLWACTQGEVDPFPSQLQKVLEGWVVASPSVTNTADMLEAVV